MTYAAYLRIYEPVAAFHEPERSGWAAYAASAARPGRRDSLAVEHAEALHRAVAAPQIVVPEQESKHAYIRRTDGVTYVCPWQTRLRCLLSYDRMLSTAGSAVPGVAGMVPARDEHETVTARPRPPGGGLPGPQTASATRALLYATSMARARRRVARGLTALRSLSPGFDGAVRDPSQAETELGEVGRWLEDFHPYSLVELDYGGLVQLLSDDALSSDQSAAEIAAAIDGVTRGERELAVAMYTRAQGRWRAFAEYEMAN